MPLNAIDDNMNVEAAMLGNEIIYGPPGTGKTRTLLAQVQDHLAKPNRRVLFCSHTRAAAQEALSRWPVKNPGNIDIQTIHSFCFRGLKLSQSQTVDTPKLGDFGREFGIDIVEEDSLGRQYLDVVNRAHASQTPPMAAYDQSWRPGTPKHFEAFVQSYDDWKSQFGFIDFNDMLRLAINGVRQTFPYTKVVIDEAQDLTPLQWEVIAHIRELLPRADFTLCGDEDQALFVWAGAAPQGMTKFGERLQATPSVLSQSYRVPKRVFDLAQRIIKQVKDRVNKEYAPRTGPDGQPIAGTLEMYPDIDSIHDVINGSRDTLVLHSDKFVRRDIEPILRDRGIVYRNINGLPAPLDTRAGRALQIAARHSVQDIEDSDDLRSTIKHGLNQYGQRVWDNVGVHTILERLRRRDMQVLSVQPAAIEYLQGVDLTVDPKVRVSTFHGSKGLEANDVLLALPLSGAAWQHAEHNPDSLHRLIYTAVTRARERLFLFDGESAYELPKD